MILSDKFICAGEQYNSFEKNVPAPYIRRSFVFDSGSESATLTVGSPGFYRAFLNGTEITKGLLAPYISNPDELVFYDSYDISDKIQAGENALVFLLGNGMVNAPGGAVWDFDKESFRASPRIAFALEAETSSGDVVIEADGSERCHDSPVYFDDLRCGERYDARNRIEGVLSVGFDDSSWSRVVVCSSSKGQKTLCNTDPVLPTGEELHPVSITEGERSLVYNPHRLAAGFDVFEKYTDTKGYIYDFGINTAGIFRLKIRGVRGQRIDGVISRERCNVRRIHARKRPLTA